MFQKCFGALSEIERLYFFESLTCYIRKYGSTCPSPRWFVKCTHCCYAQGTTNYLATDSHSEDEWDLSGRLLDTKRCEEPLGFRHLSTGPTAFKLTQLYNDLPPSIASEEIQSCQRCSVHRRERIAEKCKAGEKKYLGHEISHPLSAHWYWATT